MSSKTAWRKALNASTGVERPAPMTGEQALIKLPTTIRVGPFDYALLRWTAIEASAAGRWGECSHRECAIRLSVTVPTAIQMADCLIHEVGHAIWFSWNIEEKDETERVVTRMATGWISVYRDNPWLLGWLSECLA